MDAAGHDKVNAALAEGRSKRPGPTVAMAWSLRLLGDIVAQHDPPRITQAEDYYQRALALAQNLSMRPLMAHCHLGLGRLYGRLGPREQAQEHLGTAMRMYREMDMTFWLEKAERAKVTSTA